MGNKLREWSAGFCETGVKSVSTKMSLKLLKILLLTHSDFICRIAKGLKRVGNHAFGNIKDLSTIIVRCNCKLNYVFADSGFQTNLQTYDRENYTVFELYWVRN